MNKKSIHAETAKAIRKELKEHFPTIKFSVKSESFAGGNSVHIEYLNGPIREKVEKIIGKYEYGHFNPMTDSYEYTKVSKDIPQVKYVQVRREISEDIQEQILKKLKETHDSFETVISLDECNAELKRKSNFWSAREYIERTLSKLDLTTGLDLEEI